MLSFTCLHPGLTCLTLSDVETPVNLASSPALIPTGEAMENTAIRALIRQKLQDGRLPRGSTPRVFGRPGNWQKCDACEETMANALLMKDVYPLTNDEKSVRFHGGCYTLWNDERRELKS